MPRKPKEEVKKKLPENNTKKSNVKKTNPKSDIKKDTSKKTNTKKTTVKKTATKKATTKTRATKKTTANATKKASKTNKKADTSNLKSKNHKVEPVSIIEYYDLPYRYNQTIVKILAQTPQILFVYWDISDADRKVYENHYGNDFFSKTKPVLIIHNKTMNYSFEIEINDFANSWYLHVNDADCKYEIELGRRPYSHISTIKENYIFVSSSNIMNTPNNHILFEKFNPIVSYQNIKTGITSNKNFGKLSNYKNMQEIYNIYDLYKEIYKDELFSGISNPSSMSSSFMNSSHS